MYHMKTKTRGVHISSSSGSSSRPCGKKHLSTLCVLGHIRKTGLNYTLTIFFHNYFVVVCLSLIENYSSAIMNPTVCSTFISTSFSVDQRAPFTSLAPNKTTPCHATDIYKGDCKTEISDSPCGLMIHNVWSNFMVWNYTSNNKKISVNHIANYS